MDSPNFEGFHAQLDCKFTYGNKNQTQLTLVLVMASRVLSMRYTPTKPIQYTLLTSSGWNEQS